jgi:hypothetical protein
VTDDIETTDDIESELDGLMADNCWVAKEPEDFASEALSRFDEYYQAYQTSGVGETIARSYRMYHSMNADGHGTDAPSHSPSFIGEQGEFVYSEINHYRNHILHQKALVMSEKPAFVVHASTQEADSLEQVEMAEAVLDYAMETRGIGDALDAGVETALVESLGWIRLSWDAFAGDLMTHSLGVFDVAFQRNKRIDDAEWVIARVRESKWRLVAEARDSGDLELARDIAKSGSASDSTEKRAMPTSTVAHGPEDEEMVDVHYVYCRPTPQMPEGRYARILDDGLLVSDGPFPFREIPVYPIAPNTFLRSTVPYSNSWDLMPLQTLSNATLSAMASRIDAFGIPNVAYQEGTDTGIHENGLALWSFPPGAEKPSVLDFLGNFPSALPVFHGLMETLQDKISGVNSVVRGQPAENISSGSMAALVEAQAVKFNSPTDRALSYAAERVGMGIIRMYQAFANEDMVVSITGEDERSVVKTFSRGSLDKISRVSVQRTNPVTKTNAGRMEMANNLLAQKMIKHASEYLTVAKTGNHRSIYSDDVSLMAHIKDENTRMVNGERVSAAQQENHLIHLQEHIAKLDSRLRENNPAAAEALAQHIAEHFLMYQNISMSTPGMLMPHGIPPMPPPAQAQLLQQAMGQQQAAQQGDPEKPAGPRGPAPENKVKGAESGQRMPGLPKPAEPAKPKGQ